MIWLDTETFSEVPINHGTYKYTSNCEAMIWTSAMDDGPVIAIDLTNDEHPYDLPDLKYALEDPEQLATAHNSMFDRNVLRYSNLKLDIAIPRWRDTMVQAFTLALPGSLDKLCQIFKVNDDLAKMKDGGRLIQLFCKPRPKNAKLRRATRLTHPEEWASFIQYAINDTAAMREVAKKMPTWNYKGDELALWHLDQEVNDRGFAVDLELAHAALKAVDLEQVCLRAKTCEMTKTEAAPKGAVQSTTQRDVLLEHILESFGFSLPNLTKDTVERIIDDPDVPDGLRELLKVRLQASTSSTSKYKKLIQAATDGRLRGTIQFDGAGRTGRACLSEETLVTVRTPEGLISECPIHLVAVTDEVWDGSNWVTHEGVVFSGIKEVIEHDGVVATEEHIVYLNNETCATMAEVKSRKAAIWSGNKFT